MKYNQPEWIKPALDLIQRTDPGTYADMMASDWDVTVWMGDGETVGEFLTWDVGDVLTFLSAKGVTDGRRSMINRGELEAEVGTYSDTLAGALAETLIHEFDHAIRGEGEIPAFRLSYNFARKIGDEKLAGASLGAIRRASAGDYPGAID
jgi:hypothetical protein